MLILSTIAVAAAETAESSGTLPQFNMDTYASQLFWLAVFFGVMFWAMSSIFLPKLGGIIEERRNRLADDYDKAAEFKAQAEEAEAAYHQSLADAKAKAASIATETRNQLDEEIAAMQAETEEKLNARLAAAEASISNMQAEAAAKVQEAAVETTQALVEVLINETPPADKVSAAIAAVNS